MDFYFQVFMKYPVFSLICITKIGHSRSANVQIISQIHTKPPSFIKINFKLSIFCFYSPCFLPRFMLDQFCPSPPFIEAFQRLSRDSREGCEGCIPRNPQATPRQPPLNPLATKTERRRNIPVFLFRLASIYTKNYTAQTFRRPKDTKAFSL